MNIVFQQLVYWLVRLLHRTYRFEFHDLAHLEEARRLGCGSSYVLAIWHQNLFAGILAQTGTRHTVIVSRSRDGDPVANVCARLGHAVVRGSSKKGETDKGGREAKEEMIELLKGGLPGAITVDGPRGPAHEVKPGIVEIARRAAVPVVPYLAVSGRQWAFKSWDRFRLPKPFSTVRVYYGAPICIGADTPFADFSAHQLRIAGALDALESAHGY